MSEILDSLGIQLKPIIIYTILFVIVYVIMKKFVLDKLFEIMDKRQSEIKEGLEMKGKFESETERSAQEKQAALSAGKTEVEATKTQLKKDNDLTKKEIIENAEKEAEEIVKSAKIKLESDKKKLEADFDKRVETKAKEIAKDILADSQK